jgi:cell division transport system ATP-binding protein
MITFTHVTKRYEGSSEHVFWDFNAEIKAGEFVLVTGESGVGKTTLIRLLLKDTELTSGNIYVSEQDIGRIGEKETPFYRRKLGVVFQEDYLLPERTVYQNVELARLVAGGRHKNNRAAISSLFMVLGISHLYKRYPSQLSGGEKQKVCLARALVNYPSILLADEPTGNLSLEESKEIMRLFELAHRQGITVLVATHDKASVQGLEYREIMLTGGKDGEFKTAG